MLSAAVPQQASTVLFLLAQIPNSVAVVDLWVGRPAPTPDELGLSDSVRWVEGCVCVCVWTPDELGL